MPARPVSSTKLSHTRHHLDRAIQRAFRVCAPNPTAPECRVAWGEVDELSSVVHRMRVQERVQIVQESLCIEDPSDVECRIYDL